MPNEGLKDEPPVGFTLLHTFHSSSNINRIAYSPDGKTIASASRGEAIHLWDINTGNIKHILEGNFNFSIAWSPDGTMLAAGGIYSLFVWNEETGKLLAKLRTPTRSNKSIAWSPDGRILASGSDDGFLRLWDLAAKAILLTLQEHVSDINSIAWSPNGQTLASGSADTTVCLWDINTEQLICKFTEHFDSVNSIVWSPDGQTLATASSDNTICIWDFNERRLLDTFEGHTRPIVSIAFSPDGRLLASKSLDGTVLLRQSRSGKILAKLDEPALEYGWYSGIAFHPQEPLLATLGAKDTVIRLWSLDVGSLLGDVSTIQYTNAKVVLVGDSGVGKTGLSLVLTHQPFIPTESTHGRYIWLFDSQEVNRSDGGKEIHETYLWDLAGQPNYRFIHQLHLDEVSLALIVFDAHSDVNPFAGVNYWERVLRLFLCPERNSSMTMQRFLVAARTDRGGRSVSRTRIKGLLEELKLDAYFETSAKENWCIAELGEAIKTTINWEVLPRVSSTKLFQSIKDFIADLKKRGWALEFLDNLYRMYLDKFAVEENEELFDQFKTCINFMNSQGLIKRLSFGDYVLLKPELLDYYASALINAVNEEMDGLGSILKDRVIAGSFPIPNDNRLNKEKEEILLVAVISLLQDHDILLSENTDEGIYLVFPSQTTSEFPEATILAKKEVSFFFEGPILNIYATLAVRLSHSSFFRKKEIEKAAITFAFTNPLDNSKAVPGTYGISLQNIGEGRGKLTLAFDENASIEQRLLFKQFVYKHLRDHALAGTVLYIPICNCGETFAESTIRRRQELGFSTVKCSLCETVVSIQIDPELDRVSYQTQVTAMNNAADDKRKSEKENTNCYGESLAKMAKDKYDVFFCYDHKDEREVRRIRKELMNKAIVPWLHSWDIQPGTLQNSKLEEQIKKIPSVAVFVGRSDIGSKQQLEIEAVLHEFVKRDCPVIPCILEDASDHLELPVFLKSFQEVDFRKPKQERSPYSKFDLEQEKRLQEIRAEANHRLADARDQKEHLEAEARKRGENYLAQARKQRALLLEEANEQGKLLLVEALNQGLLLLVEAPEQEKLLQDTQELGQSLQTTPLERTKLLGEAQKQRDIFLVEARDRGERLLTEALNEGEQLLTKARDQMEQFLTEALKQGEQLLAEARTQREQLLAKADTEAEQLLVDSRNKKELFRAEDQVPDQAPSAIDLLIWGITGRRVLI